MASRARQHPADRPIVGDWIGHRSHGDERVAPGPRAQVLLERDQQHVSPSYTRIYPLVVERGSGAVIQDVDGNLFLDCTAGIAVTATGHCHPKVTRAIQQQAQHLQQSSNLFYTEPQVRLAKILVDHSFAGKVFFANSGAEANEAAIKLARRWAHERDGQGRFEIISMLNSFHGRTLATLYNAAADRGLTLRFNRNELPCFTLWKNTAALEDGYVTGLEPATNYPNFKTF